MTLFGPLFIAIFIAEGGGKKYPSFEGLLGVEWSIWGVGGVAKEITKERLKPRIISPFSKHGKVKVILSQCPRKIKHDVTPPLIAPFLVASPVLDQPTRVRGGRHSKN